MARDEKKVSKALDEMMEEMFRARRYPDREDIINAILRKTIDAIDAGATKKEIRHYYQKHLNKYVPDFHSDYLRG